MKWETTPKLRDSREVKTGEVKRGEIWLVLIVKHTDCAAEREISPNWLRKNILAMVGTMSMIR